MLNDTQQQRLDAMVKILREHMGSAKIPNDLGVSKQELDATVAAALSEMARADAAEAELEKVKDSRATMALQNASLLTDLDQVISDSDAAEAKVKALEAKLAKLVETAEPCEWEASTKHKSIGKTACGAWTDKGYKFCPNCDHPVVVKGGEARKKGAEHGE